MRLWSSRHPRWGNDTHSHEEVPPAGPAKGAPGQSTLFDRDELSTVPIRRKPESYSTYASTNLAPVVPIRSQMSTDGGVCQKCPPEPWDGNPKDDPYWTRIPDMATFFCEGCQRFLSDRVTHDEDGNVLCPDCAENVSSLTDMATWRLLDWGYFVTCDPARRSPGRGRAFLASKSGTGKLAEPARA
jgi:hypothetical protein